MFGIGKFLNDFFEALAGEFKTTSGKDFFNGINKIPREKLTKQDNIISMMFIENPELMEKCDFDRIVLKKLERKKDKVHFKKVKSPYYDTSSTHNGFTSKYAGKTKPHEIGNLSLSKIIRERDTLEKIKLTSQEQVSSSGKYLILIQTSIGAPKEVMKKIELLMKICIKKYEANQNIASHASHQ